MNKQKQILILVAVVIVAALIFALYFMGGSKVGAPQQNVQPVAGDTGKFTPKLNNTLETSVTVINPNEAPAGQPAQ